MGEHLGNAELDELVAIEIMAWNVAKGEYRGKEVEIYLDDDGVWQSYANQWKPTRNIAQAWQVLSKFHWPFCYPRLRVTETGKWLCEIVTGSGDGPIRSGAAQTAPRAICIACLVASGIDVKGP